MARTRREFLDYLITASAIAAFGSVFYPIWRFVLPPARKVARQIGAVFAAKAAEVPPNSAKVFPIGSRPGIVIHTEKGEWCAFSATCTHLGCVVRYRQDQQMIWCPCHDGWYDLQGKNVKGPPPRPLAPYRIVMRGDDVYVAEETTS